MFNICAANGKQYDTVLSLPLWRHRNPLRLYLKRKRARLRYFKPRTCQSNYSLHISFTTTNRIQGLFSTSYKYLGKKNKAPLPAVWTEKFRQVCQRCGYTRHFNDNWTLPRGGHLGQRTSSLELTCMGTSSRGRSLETRYGRRVIKAYSTTGNCIKCICRHFLR